MSGTISTVSNLMAQSPDNTSGQVSPAVLRNFGESLAAQPPLTSSATAITPDATYRGATLYCTASSAVTITVNSGVFTSAQGFFVRQFGTGQVTIAAGSGMTRQSSTGTFATRAQYSLISVTIYTDGTTIMLDGDLA